MCLSDFLLIAALDLACSYIYEVAMPALVLAKPFSTAKATDCYRQTFHYPSFQHKAAGHPQHSIYYSKYNFSTSPEYSQKNEQCLLPPVPRRPYVKS